MADAMQTLALARVAYDYATTNYGKKGARYDVIVECMTIDEIAAELEGDGANTEAKARKWADRRAGLAHEVELNQAWDGPESCIGSERYDPAFDPAGDPRELPDPRDAEFERWNQAEAAADLEARWNGYASEERTWA